MWMAVPKVHSDLFQQNKIPSSSLGGTFMLDAQLIENFAYYIEYNNISI